MMATLKLIARSSSHLERLVELLTDQLDEAMEVRR